MGTTVASLLGHDGFGSRLESLCRFSFKRSSSLFRAGTSSNKRRKIAFEDKGISTAHIEVKLLGVDNCHGTSESTTSQVSSSFGIAEKELIHVSLPNGRGDCTKQGAKSSPMLRQNSPRHGDIQREERRIVRPVSLPNLCSNPSVVHSETPEAVKDIINQKPVNDEEGTELAAMPCLQSNCIREAPGNHVTHKESGILPSEPKGSAWEFKVIASVKSQNRNLISTDVIGTIAFEKKNEYFATGGIARKIRVYAYSSLTSGISPFDDDEDDDEEEDSTEYLKERRRRKRRNSTTDIDHARCCVHEVCTPAKLSSLQWHRERPNLIACGDYDGVVAEWDVERTCAVSERDENGGQRIWSIDYSKDFPDLIASASDDGTVRMWDRSSEESVAVLTPPTYSSICCAEFGPISSSLIALASADSNVYLYDTRWLSTPLLTLAHHKRAASYVRFLNRHSLVSSSIDSSVKLWDISGGFPASPIASKHCSLPVKSYNSHYNVRNFTGLSVRGEGGLIACGSETNQAFVYESQKCNPVLIHSFDYGVRPNLNPKLGSWSADRVSDHAEGGGSNSLIVSAVCWRMEPNDCTLVAANSDGVLQILSGSSQR